MRVGEAVLRTKGSTPSPMALAIALACMALAGCSGPPDGSDPAALPAAGGRVAASRAPASADGEDPGATVYRKACHSCHQKGLVGAPRFGDRAAWAPRIARGVETLVEHALNGFRGDAGVMPPRGGHPYLSEGEVAAAVEHMVRAVR